MIFRLDKICIWLLILCFAALLCSAGWVKWIDEAVCYLLLAVGIADCVVNRRWRDYTPLLVVMAIMAGYAVYSLFKDYNTAPYIAMDYIIELKPFVPFIVLLAIRPRLSALEKRTLQVIAVINTLAVLVLYAVPVYREYTMGMHIMYLGTTCFVSAIIFLLSSIRDDGSVPWTEMAVVVVILLIGLGCTRAKYYAEFVAAIFFLFAYRPGMLHSVKPAYWFLALVTMALVVFVTWDKFTYYFITGNSDTFDPDVAESFARPVLYVTSGLILITEIPFGSGLASFASYASSVNYSDLYHEYGISSIYGLSEAKPDFICDAFYPSLAQFGLVGIALFVWFWVWAFKPIKRMVRLNAANRYWYAAGALCLCFIMIENVASTMLMQSWGMVTMMTLGLVACTGVNDNELEKIEDNEEYREQTSSD